MYWINNQPLSWDTIKLQDGKWYSGPDEIKTLLANTWREIEQKFFHNGESVIFNTPGMLTAGRGKGNQGYAYPRVVRHRTKKGPATIAWADEKKENKDGTITYSPISKVVSPDKRCMRLGEDDIEEIIWMILFNPFVVKPGNPTGRTFLEDKEADALKYAESETNSAVISYWLFREESPFYNSPQKLSTLCLAWGVNPEGKSITYMKQLLAEAVKKAEKRGELEFNLKAFNSVCEKIKDGQDTRTVDALALIQLCINKHVIRLDNETFRWTLLGLDGKTVIKTVCKIPPQSIGQAKGILKAHLIANPDDYSMLSAAANNEPMEGKNDRVILSAPMPSPEEITEDYLTNDLSWAEKKRVYRLLGHEPRSATLEQIMPILIEYFIIQKKTVPFEVVTK